MGRTQVAILEKVSTTPQPQYSHRCALTPNGRPNHYSVLGAVGNNLSPSDCLQPVTWPAGDAEVMGLPCLAFSLFVSLCMFRKLLVFTFY